MIPKAEAQHKRFPDAFDIEAVRNCTTIGEFDDAYIARIYNFKDRYDYYRQCGSKWFLPTIRVPTFAINAIDDPFIDERALPTPADVGDAPVRLIYHAHGGHCGFSTDQMSIEADAPPVPAHGWIAEEIARCLEHIRNHS
jgi:predicted alpha/beta-fold hydrolase